MGKTRRRAVAGFAIALVATVVFLAGRAGGGTLRPTLMELLLATFACSAAVVLVCAIALTRDRVRWLWLLAFPVLLVTVVIGELMIPVTELAHVRLADGRTVHLSLDDVPTDVVYSLWEETLWGSYWRRLDADLSYSEDGRFVDDERLVLSKDGRRLLVSRGGVWTDCLDAHPPFSRCENAPGEPLWTDPRFDELMRRNSRMFEGLL